MKRLVLVLLFLPMLAVAGQSRQLDTSGLTPEQIAELQIQASKMKSPANISATVRKEATAWADLGANIGTAMVSAAKEIGVAANEFSQTGLGKIVTGIIVYKVLGRDILGVIFGGGILLVGGVFTLMIFRSTRFATEVQYEYVPVLWGMFNRRRVVKIESNGDQTFGRCLSTGIVGAMTLLVGLNCIF